MSIPGNSERQPGATSGHPDEQHQSSVHFSSAIPIKKRRFPIIQPGLSSAEEKASDSSSNDPKDKKESSLPGGNLSLSDERHKASLGNSDASKTSAFLVKKEVFTPTNLELGQTNADILASKPREAKPFVSLGSVNDSRNKSDVISTEKQTGSGVPGSSVSGQTTNVKQEIGRAQVGDAPRLELSMSSMNIELSLGPRELPSPARFEKSDPTMLSLAPIGENHSLHSNYSNTTGSGVRVNRSSWDLNTIMDAWEGSDSGIENSTAHQHVESDDLGKSNRSNDAKLVLNASGAFGPYLNKGKHCVDDCRSTSVDASLQSSLHSKTDDSLGLKLAMPFRESIANTDRPSLAKLAPTRVSPQVNLQPVRLTAVSLNRAVKSEPIDDNSKCDFSIGSCSSDKVGLSKLNSVKLEPPTASPAKLVDNVSMKSEAVEGHFREKSKDIVLPESVVQVMQHQESCASSSVVPALSMPENSRPSTVAASSNHTEHAYPSKESSQDHNDKSEELNVGMFSNSVSQDTKKSNPEASGKSELAPSNDVTGNDEEKFNIPADILEDDAFGSDSESQEMDIDDENGSNKEYEEYEDGEVRDPSQDSTGENQKEKTENVKLVERISRNSQDPDSVSAENSNAKKDCGDMVKDRVSICYEPKNEDCPSQSVSDNVTELRVDVKSVIAAEPGKRLNASGKKAVERSAEKEAFINSPNKGIHGMKTSAADETANKAAIKEICSGENDSTLSKEDTSFNDNDTTKDSNNIGNKSRIINLSRTSVATAPAKTRPIIPNRLPTSRSGKERYSDPDIEGDAQPRANNRDEFYMGGSKKFFKDRVHDRTFRNSFMRGKGRTSGRFGSLRREWDSDHSFVSENYRGSSDNRPMRRKHTSAVPNDLDYNGYGVPHDVTALGNGRRKEVSDEFSPLRRPSFRRFSPGGGSSRDGADTRDFQTMHQFSRNMGPGQCVDDGCSDMVGIRHDNKFMRHLSEDMIDPVYGRQQEVYDELDDQLMRGNRNFRNGYLRIGSKSPARSRTRSPGPWLSPRRRSPNGPPAETMYRMGRMRSPEHDCFHEDIIPRRRVSPYRNVDSGRDHTNHRPRRTPPARGFLRHGRRSDTIDSHGMGDGGKEYKFHGGGDGSAADERRNFIERRGLPARPFRPMYSGDSDDFQFHQSNGPARPYRFCPPDADGEFIERSGNVRGREFEGRPRRVRNMDEQAMERGWHDDGYGGDGRMKRMRF
ncbi:uncharacterized protein LOC127256246 [Andrographis paniculata]|uniref:uncharacterized protein LOC127256246 n=1 Tax=Andrographis paniculata TaxID=175694 RepID=UPI0021E73C4A|nr:uncharacterized protein LOC127256246 [Andrographis paniculata]XP_051138107.1 uncharacterized protein LOC127256246 [Andrographis paniculata]XP_051138108.1 uncharacterized protein LOC127256246 [Andrographis paniculata]